MTLAKARQEIQRWGFSAFFYDCLMSALKPWFTLCVVQVRPMHPERPPKELFGGREVRVATTRELLQASADPALDLKPDWIQRAMARGEICVAVFEGDKILAYLWRAFGPTPHDADLWVEFDANYSYSFKGFTRPECRRQRLQQAVSYKLDPWLRERNFTHSIRFVETHNYPSLVRRPDHRSIGYAGYLRLFGRVIPFRTSGARRHGFAFQPLGKTRRPARVRSPAS